MSKTKADEYRKKLNIRLDNISKNGRNIDSYQIRYLIDKILEEERMSPEDLAKKVTDIENRVITAELVI